MAANGDLTEDEVRGFFTSLSNWGKWGPTDQLGTLNYITPDKRRRAGAEVRDGQSVSLSLPLATRPAPDNPTPVTHLMVQTGARGESGGLVDAPYSADYFAISPHGLANTHLDALCHVFNQGKMYNGYPASDVTSQGARNGAIDALKDGIVTRGVLIDAPRVLGREWLEPGEAISPADIEAAEKSGNFRVEEGDILFVRTGRHVRQKARGPWNSFKDGLAGLGAACLPWLHERKVALLGCDGVSDVIPSGFPKVTMPIHTVAIVTMGIHLIDNCNLDDVAAACAARSRWTFLCAIAPLVLIRGTASPVNPLAVF
jgi:kynurenine formamidase